MECKHENAEHMMPGDTTTPDWLIAPFVAQCEQFRCIDCGAWLSLGNARDRTAAVKREIAAAEIAYDTTDLDGGNLVREDYDGDIYDGWWHHERNSDFVESWEWIGYLARQILHGEPGEPDPTVVDERDATAAYRRHRADIQCQICREVASGPGHCPKCGAPPEERGTELGAVAARDKALDACAERIAQLEAENARYATIAKESCRLLRQRCARTEADTAERIAVMLDGIAAKDPNGSAHTPAGMAAMVRACAWKAIRAGAQAVHVSAVDEPAIDSDAAIDAAADAVEGEITDLTCAVCGCKVSLVDAWTSLSAGGALVHTCPAKTCLEAAKSIDADALGATIAAMDEEEHP